MGMGQPARRSRKSVIVALLTLSLVGTMDYADASKAGQGPDAHRWATAGGDQGFSRFSPAAQVTPANVNQLQPVWKFTTAGLHGRWSATPIVVNGTMFTAMPDGSAVSLDPETGKLMWTFKEPGSRGSVRGISYWPGDATHGPRLIHITGSHIYALDPETGKPVPGFGGDGGFVDIGKLQPEKFGNPPAQFTSPPLIYDNLLIVGGSTNPYQFANNGPRSDPHAFDIVTGKLVWTFHLVPEKGEPNAGAWGSDWKDRTGPSSWGLFTADAGLGMVYIPVGNASNVYLGMDRPGSNLYSASIVALDAKTGKYRWHYQVTHHDIFDYDLAAPPTVLDLNVKGRKVPALIVVGKTGMMFILDRRTGKPIFGAEERPVPASSIPGEHASPTQPFPLKPPPLAKLGMSRSDISTVTPESNRYCTAIWDKEGMQDTPMYGPPKLNGATLFMPSNGGGAGGIWGGVSTNPQTGMIYVNTTNYPSFQRTVADPSSPTGYKIMGVYTPFLDQYELPCNNPPWGELIAINGNSGDIVWRRPLGESEVLGELGKYTGTLSGGATLATGGGLIFATGMLFDPAIRAYDSRTGEQLWSARLSGYAGAPAMTYIGKSGRQYVVTSMSLSPLAFPDAETALVAFALPLPGDVPVHWKPAPKAELAKGAVGPTTGSATPQLEGARTGVPNVPLPTRIEDFAAAPGKKDFVEMCAACHPVTTVASRRRTRSEWSAVIGLMQARGAPGDDAKAASVLNYLATVLGLENPK